MGKCETNGVFLSVCACVWMCVLILVCKNTKGNRCNQESVLGFLFQACFELHARLQVIAVINKSRIFPEMFNAPQERWCYTCDVWFILCGIRVSAFLFLSWVSSGQIQTVSKWKSFLHYCPKISMEQLTYFYTANIFMVVIRETVLTERGKNAQNAVPFSF